MNKTFILALSVSFLTVINNALASKMAISNLIDLDTIENDIEAGAQHLLHLKAGTFPPTYNPLGALNPATPMQELPPLEEDVRFPIQPVGETGDATGGAEGAATDQRPSQVFCLPHSIDLGPHTLSAPITSGAYCSAHIITLTNR